MKTIDDFMKTFAEALFQSNTVISFNNIIFAYECMLRGEM